MRRSFSSLLLIGAPLFYAATAQTQMDSPCRLVNPAISTTGSGVNEDRQLHQQELLRQARTLARPARHRNLLPMIPQSP